jgi:hypothetical protein
MTTKELLAFIAEHPEILNKEIVLSCEHDRDIQYAHRTDRLYIDIYSKQVFLVIQPSYHQLADDE